ncbi:hypothetical protein FA13DRAFT_1773201 [Coprinellus micaceus]|uniref:Uncharacterized protein n=1 Tax=Coprinellus micaceus TaxID=71717 RepID=A0A4Y7TI02_COPMI|nr:hypothetical protein FA13DRAFT_1773201 [Coprinellus micaceus]
MSPPTPSSTDTLVDDILIETFAFLALPSHQSFRDVLTVSHDDAGELTLDAGWDSESDRPVGVLRRELGMRERLRRYSLPLFAGKPNWWSLLTSPPTFGSTNQGQTTWNFTGPGSGTCRWDSMKWLFGEDLRIPRLRKLALTNMSAELELPHLVELDLAMDFTCISLLLSHLSLPKCRSVKVTFLRCEDPGDGDAGEAEFLRDMVVRATEQIIERVVVPLISQRRQQEPSGNTVSFLRCMEMAVEYIFSPHLHDAPYRARDPSPDDVTVVIGFPWPSGKTTMRGVLDGWASASSGSSLCENEYGEIVEEFVRNPSVGVERVMYSSDWARRFGEVDEVVEPMAEERIRAVDPPVEKTTAAGE